MINEYLARKVALKDMQPCLICGKPSTTVLYNNSGPDWFYTCDIHLKDNPQFVTPIYSKEYEQALIVLKDLKVRINNSAVKKAGSWDSWVSTIFVKSKDKEQATTQSDTAGSETKDATNAGDPKDDTNAKMDESKDLQRRYNEQLDLVTGLQKQNRKYQLSKVTFESRVLRKKNEERLAEKRRLERQAYTHTDPEELLQQYSFPAVPKT